MLRSHLIVKTDPVAKRENLVFWKDYRISVLGDRLFRMEKSEDKQFRDKATQAVWYRNMPMQKFTLERGEDSLLVDTGVCKLVIEDGEEWIEMQGERIPLDNKGNLLGTYRTLDCCNGDVHFIPWIEGDEPKKIQLGKGVCSKTGVAVLQDDSLSLGEDGEVKNERANGSDCYIFAYGKDYRGAVCALYDLTGYTPLVPRFALGNWWSRYHIYTDKEYLRVLSAFEEREIPLAVATVDMDWHYSEDVDRQKGITAQGKKSKKYVGENAVNLGWTGYSWNADLFPNYKDFLRKIKEKGLKITLNLHPSDGVRFWEDAYEEMAKRMGQDPSSEEQIPFDFTYDTFINAYFDVLHRPYEQDGVDFWWIDWQQPNIAWHGEESENGLGDYDPLWALNHYHYLDNASGGKTPLVLSRYAGIGSHRYPLGFSGDTEITWETLAYLPYFTATASNAGYSWWSHDIGGHNFGTKQDELYLRHLQYGVFSPINRLHCACDETMRKEPWAYQNGTGLIAENFLRLRHELVPYLYTASYLTATKGKALVEPLYYEWDCKQAYEYTAEYLFGSELLVAPVIQEGGKGGYAKVSAWLPQGTWTDIFTGDCYEIGAGGKEVTLLRTMDSIPVLIKSGGILPLSKDKGNGCKNPKNLEIWSYKGNGKYTLYEDGKEEDNEGIFRTRFTSAYQKCGKKSEQRLWITSEGDDCVYPKGRTLSIRFKDIAEGEVTLYIDGEKSGVEEWITDCAAIRFPFESGKNYEIVVSFQEPTVLEKAKLRAQKELVLAEGGNRQKYGVFKQLLKAENLEQFIRIAEESPLSETVKARIKETL